MMNTYMERYYYDGVSACGMVTDQMVWWADGFEDRTQGSELWTY